MYKKLNQFTCDSCGSLIEDPTQGWVEWESKMKGKPAQKKYWGFKIVHHYTHSPLKNGCYHYQSNGLILKYFLGQDQMHRILSFLDQGPIHSPIYSEPEVTDMREFIEFTRRLTIPYYEEARQYWNDAVSDGYFNSQNEIKIYEPDNLKRLIEKYSPKF